jgi:hypothetical protein
MKKRCLVCNKKADSDYCFLHKAKKKLSTKKPLVTTSKPGETRALSDMFIFMIEIWNEKKHYSEVSNIWLGNEISSVFFHHILPKSKFKEAAFDKENIILLTFDEHTQVETDIYRYHEVNVRREQLITKYNLK